MELCEQWVRCALSTKVPLPKAPVVHSVSKGVRILSHRGATAAGTILLYFQDFASCIWKVKLKTLYMFRKSHAVIMCDTLHFLQSSSSYCPASPGLYVFCCCMWNKHFHLLFAGCSVHVRCFLPLYFGFTVKIVTLSQLQHTVIISSLGSVVLQCLFCYQTELLLLMTV